MTKEVFQAQLRLLGEVYGNSNYSAPVAALLWKAFQNVADEVFVAACEHEVATRPARHKPPLLEELDKACEAARVRINQQGPRGVGGLYDVLAEASRVNSCDKDFKDACMKLLRQKVAGELNMAQFLEGCEMLDGVAQRLRPEVKTNLARSAPRYPARQSPRERVKDD